MADNNWTEAGKLGLDNILLDIHENNTSIVNLRSYSQDAVVYNLTVANDHTYFVGISGVLGHNAGCPLGEFKLPNKVRSPKGISGKFTIRKYSYRIDTNNIHQNEIFHVHIYERNKEIAKITARGGWLPMHGGKPLPAKPSTIPKLLRKEINKLINHVKIFL